MATEDGVKLGAYVHRVTKGYKRLFFNVSLPLDELHWLPDEGMMTRQPEEVAKLIAAKLDPLLLERR